MLFRRRRKKRSRKRGKAAGDDGGYRGFIIKHGGTLGNAGNADFNIIT